MMRAWAAHLVDPVYAFTLDEVMNALNDAFERAGAPSGRDCLVAERLREILSARTGLGKATETGREIARRRKNVEQP